MFRVNPADLSNATVFTNSTSVISAFPSAIAKLPPATNTIGLADVLLFPLCAEPASMTQPFSEANTSFFCAVVKCFGFDSSESLAPHNAMILSPDI